MWVLNPLNPSPLTPGAWPSLRSSYALMTSISNTSLKLCLVHDLPEVIVGDLTPQDDVSTKSADERAAMEQIAPEWVSLFDEYEHQTTPEAVFVKRLDKLDMALQAQIYTDRSDIDLEQFIESARKTLGDHELLR